MPRTRNSPVSIGKLAIGFLGVVVTIIFMSYVSDAWKLAVYALALAVLGYLAALYGVDSRDGKSW